MSLPHSDSNPNTERPWWRYVLVILLFLIPLALYLGAPLVVHVPEHYQHILLTITAVMGIHVLDRLFLVKDTEKALNKLMDGVREDISKGQGTATKQIAKDTENLVHAVREDIKKDRGTALESISGNTEKLMHGVREDISRDTEKLMHGVREDISRQTSSLRHLSTSLEAMSRGGIIQVYTSRKEAAGDIKEDVTNPANSKIRLIGISLNDFVQGIDQTLSEAWQIVKAYIRRQRRIDDCERGLDIRVLIIDPSCFGATLRSGSEAASSHALADRLENEVRAAARELNELEADAAKYKADTGVTFECRLYRLPPILFLCSVDSTCYVQQYHFWSHRDNRTPLPVLKFRKLEAGAGGYQYHTEMEHHFDWIWEHAAIPVSAYLDCASTGTDKALNQCSVVNIYSDTDKAKERMIYLLKNAQKKVSIQGISLQSFFESGKLYDALYNVVANGVMDLEVLLLDPGSEQAKSDRIVSDYLLPAAIKHTGSTSRSRSTKPQSFTRTHTEQSRESSKCLSTSRRGTLVSYQSSRLGSMHLLQRALFSVSTIAYWSSSTTTERSFPRKLLRSSGRTCPCLSTGQVRPSYIKARVTRFACPLASLSTILSTPLPNRDS